MGAWLAQGPAAGRRLSQDCGKVIPPPPSTLPVKLPLLSGRGKHTGCPGEVLPLSLGLTSGLRGDAG